MGFYIDTSNNYYEGDKAEFSDAEVLQRPDYNHAWNGFAWIYTPPAVSSVSRRQGRLALSQAGLLAALEAWIAAQPVVTQIWYQDTSTFDAANPIVMQAATALGWNAAQLSALFTLAATL